MSIEVVAAVIEHAGHFLLTRRQDGVHLAGMWEFPGGKVVPGESHPQALVREILEELGAEVAVRQLVLQTTHRYPDRAVTLYFYRCDLVGSPAPRLGQQMEWVPRAKLASLDFPPADIELIRQLVEEGREPAAGGSEASG